MATYTEKLLSFIDASPVNFLAVRNVCNTLLDNGFVVSKYTEIMSTKEAKIMIQQYGMTQTDVNNALGALETASPLSITLSILNINLIISLVASLVISLFTYGNNRTL